MKTKNIFLLRGAGPFALLTTFCRAETARRWVNSSTRDLATTNWIMPPETINNDGTNNFIVVSPLTGNLFFRLEQ